MFLIYFFSTKKMEKFSILYSHFIFSLYSGNLYIRIFYYDSYVFIKANNFFDRMNNAYRKKSNRRFGFNNIFRSVAFASFFFKIFKFNFFKDIFIIRIIRVIVFFMESQHPQNFYIILAFIKDSLLAMQYKRLSKSKLPIHDEIYNYTYNYDYNYKIELHHKYLLFYFLVLKKFLDFTNSENISISGQKEGFEITYYRLILSYVFYLNSFIIKFLGKFLCSIFSFLLIGVPFHVSFFLMSNDSITSKFVAKYIAVRLSHGYSIRELLNPIIKEFYLVSLLTKSSPTRYFNDNGVFLNTNQSTGLAIYRKNVVKTFFMRFSFMYKKHYLKFYNIFYTFLNFYLFSFFF